MQAQNHVDAVRIERVGPERGRLIETCAGIEQPGRREEVLRAGLEIERPVLPPSRVLDEVLEDGGADSTPTSCADRSHGLDLSCGPTECLEGTASQGAPPLGRVLPNTRLRGQRVLVW